MKYDVCRYHLINTNKKNLIFSGCIRKIANDPTIRINQIVAYNTSRYSNFIKCCRRKPMELAPRMNSIVIDF